MATTKTIYLHTGSNLGNRLSNLLLANQYIEERIGKIQKASTIHQTLAWGKTDQADFLNQALCVQTCLNPKDLIHCVLDIEHQMGRVRFEKWGSRLIDIDVLLYGNEIIKMSNLIVPHPLMHLRGFVLEPLVEIAADVVHPILKESVQHLHDTLKINTPKKLGRSV